MTTNERDLFLLPCDNQIDRENKNVTERTRFFFLQAYLISPSIGIDFLLSKLHIVRKITNNQLKLNRVDDSNKEVCKVLSWNVSIGRGKRFISSANLVSIHQ